MDGIDNTVQPLPSASELLKTNPLQFINDGFEQQVGLLESKFAESRANLTRDSDNRLRVLDREYQIDLQAMEQRYRQMEASQENMQRAATDLIRLNAQYQKKSEGIRGKIEPDLKDWEAGRNMMLQQLEADRDEKIRQIGVIQQLFDEGIITNNANAQAKIYSIATGMNLSPSFFEQPDPNKEAVRLGMLAVELDEQGRHEEAEAARRQGYQLSGQVAPNAAKAVKNATRFSGLEGRQKARQARREKERAGTLAEGIVQAKNKATKKTVTAPFTYSGFGPFGHFGTTRMREASVPTKEALEAKSGPAPIYASNPTTGQRIVSYDGGKTWQTAQ